MSKESCGGWAFPTQVNRQDGFGNNYVDSEEGMELRDYFAAKAAAALEPPKDYVGAQEAADSYAKWARKAYRMADALLKARG